MTNIAHLKYSPDPLERAAFWIADYARSGGQGNFDELQDLSNQLQKLAPWMEELRSFAEHVAEHRGVYRTDIVVMATAALNAK